MPTCCRESRKGTRRCSRPPQCSACLAWKSGVAAEVIGVATGSIGERLYEAKVFLSSADLFAWTIVIIVLSVVCERLLLRALRSVPGAPVRAA